MINRKDILWQAIRQEVELTLDSTDHEATSDQIDTITDEVIMDDYIWNEFNSSVMEIIENILG